MSRSSLPYRETTDCFLLYKNQIVSKDYGHYVAFPGGGLDKGEDAVKASKREIMEEVGGVVKNLKVVGVVEWDWFPEWADTPKRKKRYKQFRGERVYLLVGEVTEFKKATSTEGDAWKGKKTMSLKKAIEIGDKVYKKEHPNAKTYKMMQNIIIKTMKQML